MAALIQRTDPSIGVFPAETSDEAFAASMPGAPPAQSQDRSCDAIVISVTPCSHEDLGRICEQLRGRPAVPVILVMTSVAPATAAGLTNLGVRGIVLSSASPEVLVAAIRMAAGGATYLPPELVRGTQADSGLPSLENLTQREIQILLLLGEGLSNKQIARRLQAKEATIKVQIHRMLRKLRVANRTQAAVLVSRHDFMQGHALAGLIPIESGT
ncbi:MAG TPA: response regulator transcription factor [Dongiaceae bacterium]|nr:response regulator transcription factor [Dongiaceae bacterium]